MSKIILQPYNKSYSIEYDSCPEYKKCMQAQVGEKVFIYKKDPSKTWDEANISIIQKHFGLAKTFKRNSMAVEHTQNINDGQNKDSISFNAQRLAEINNLNRSVADFFLDRLLSLTWDDYETGVLSTIPFDEAFDLLVPAMKMLYEILAAAIEDKYSKDLSVAEMKNVLERHNLLIDQTLGKNIPHKKK